MPPVRKNGNRAGNGGSIVRGVLLLARGRAEGLLEFGSTPEAFGASLAPLIAFPLVAAALIAANGQPRLAAIAFLSRLCGVLVLAVITQGFAQLMKREALWLRAVTALNWVFWILVPMAVLAGFVASVLAALGLGELRAEAVGLVLLGAYLLWLHWFVVRNALQLSGWTAAVLVVVTNVAIGLLTLGPDLVGMAFKK